MVNSMLILTAGTAPVPCGAQNVASETGVAVPPVPVATIDDGLEVAGDGMAAGRVENRMTLPVEIDGHGPFRFVVDSGADRSVIGRGVATSLALPPGDPVRLVGVVNASTVQTVRVRTMRLGVSELTDLDMPSLLERDLGAQGLVGIDALAEQRLMLDFERGRVTIEDARRRARSLPGEIVVTARRRNGQLIITQVDVAGRSAMAVIDSGAMLSVGNMALLRRIGRDRRLGSRTTTLIDVTGAARTVPIVIVPELRVGALRLVQVPMAFADLPPFARFGLREEPAVLLGTDALEAFARVSLDFRRRKVRFQLRRRDRVTTGSRL